MHDLNVREKTTFIFSTHDPRLLDRVTRRIRLQGGEILSDGSGQVHAGVDWFVGDRTELFATGDINPEAEERNSEPFSAPGGPWEFR